MILMAAMTALAAHSGVAACPIEQAQTRFAMTPRPVAEVAALLDACDAAGSNDFRIPLFRGVMARERGAPQEAVTFLRLAHDIQPADPVPLLELGLTEEWLDQNAAAAAIYSGMISAGRRPRPAVLGLARIARARSRFREAEALYRGLLARDSNDLDAANGLGWVMLAEGKLALSRAQFVQSLAQAPQNSEALAGIAALERGWRFKLDANGGRINTDGGNTWTGNAALTWQIDARDHVDLGFTQNGDELPSASVAILSFLPSTEVHFGFGRQTAARYWSIEYDYRAYDSQPDQHRLRLGGGADVGRNVQLFASYRQGFGKKIDRDQLASIGAIVGLGKGWEVAGTLYRGAYYLPVAPNRYRHYSSGAAGGIDLNRQGPGIAFLNVGIAYSERVNNLDLHGRVAIPVGDRTAVTVAAQHISILDKNEVRLGFQVYWK